MDEKRSDHPGEAARKAREARLAAALRANLRRRKAAGRNGADTARETGDAPPASPGDGPSD